MSADSIGLDRPEGFAVWSKVTAAGRPDTTLDALDHFDPLLVQLTLGDAPEKAIIQEGFTAFELAAVRSLVKRAGITHHEPTGNTITYRPLEHPA